jgi:4-hydroxyphenylpyruvate dioxygenase
MDCSASKSLAIVEFGEIVGSRHSKDMSALSMDIDHIHFFVKDAVWHRNALVEKMGFQHSTSVTNAHTRTEVLQNGAIYFVLSAPLTQDSPAFNYLQAHSEGVVDVALRVDTLDPFLSKRTFNAEDIQSQQTHTGTLRWAKVPGWGALSHTLIENTTDTSFCDVIFAPASESMQQKTGFTLAQTVSSQTNGITSTFNSVDHVVLNVPAGELTNAVTWYRDFLGLQVRQSFNIQTQRSGLQSQVLELPNGQLYFNINEPTSANSQIQEFLDCNRGAGIQHIALHTPNLLQTVSQLRQRGQSFLSIPKAYYTQLKQRLMSCAKRVLSPTELQAIQTQGVLADWELESPASLLLQIFTPPIFDQPTFFLS